jgi:hypothetical protein
MKKRNKPIALVAVLALCGIVVGVMNFKAGAGSDEMKQAQEKAAQEQAQSQQKESQPSLGAARPSPGVGDLKGAVKIDPSVKGLAPQKAPGPPGPGGPGAPIGPGGPGPGGPGGMSAMERMRAMKGMAKPQKPMPSDSNIAAGWYSPESTQTLSAPKK